MSSNLRQQIDLTSKATALNVAPPISSVTKVSTLRGQTLYLPAHQIPQSNPNDIIKNPWIFNGDGNFQLMLQNVGIQNIKIARGQGSGKVTGRVWLRMLVQNTSGTAVETAPAPFWFSNLNLQTPGGDIIQNYDPFGLWFSIIATTALDEWFSLSDLVAASNDYQSGSPFEPNSTREILIPLVGNPYSCGQVATREMQGDSMFYCTTAAPANWVLSGPTNALQVSQFQLLMEMQQLDSQLISALDAEYSAMPHDFIYPFQRVMNFTQTFNVNSQYTFQLSGITGDVAFCVFILRNSSSQWDAYHGLPISSFQLQNQEGIPISGAQFVTENYDRFGLAPQQYLGTWMQDRRYYAWNFSAKDSAPVEFLLTGRKNTAYGFTGNEQIVINTPPAGTNEVATFTSGNGAAAIAAGSYVFFQWTTENGYTWQSPGFDLFGKNATQIKAIIENITGFEGQVSCVVAAGPPYVLTVTFIGNYANRPLQQEGFSLNLIGVLLHASSTPAGILEAVSVPGVRGITNGQTATFTFLAFTSSIMNVTGGRQRIQNS